MEAAVRAERTTTVAGLDEVAELYAHRAGEVRRQVRGGVRAPEPVVEDACQCAWARLLGARDRVAREAAFSWVVTTALHEALRSLRRSSREVSLDGLMEAAGEPEELGTAPAPDLVVDARLRLWALRALPERQQRLVWLQGLGFDRHEMGDATGATVRTVERQLKRARLRLGDLEA